MSFSPYASNGGTVLGVSGEDFAIIASDTRLSEGYSIHTRESPKSYKLTPQTVLGCAGFHGDVLTLVKQIEARLTFYKQTHNKNMGTASVAQMLATMLYGKRFFPYYTYNILGGIDDEGKGCIFSFDPVGSYEREVFRAGGTASSLLQPLLDNQIGFKNQEGAEHVPLTKEQTIGLVKDVFISAAERDIYTGDAVELQIITKEGIEVRRFPLRRD
eukprot:m.479606 g.479606  ORF g.479606 m.479606 type:complete len:215 (+) comp21703_c0_seq2:185-829(+)